MYDIRLLKKNSLNISPSLLAADFGNLREEINEVTSAGADLLHWDIMDGHFVPNLTMGPPVMKSLRKDSQLVFDTHLMLSNPLSYIEPFARAGADHITFHLESNDDTMEAIQALRKLGCTVGISLKPATPPEALHPYLPYIDLVLIMTVEPGFGGQKFMHEMVPKIRAVRERINDLNLPIHLEVDGGVDVNTVHEVVEAGADMLVAGTAVFRHLQGMKAGIDCLRIL